MSAFAQRDIVKSLQTDVAGQGKVTIHQDEKITASLNAAGALSAQLLQEAITDAILSSQVSEEEFLNKVSQAR